MDIKRTSVQDIYQSVSKGQDMKELYKKLNSTLGESNPFAKFDIGNGFYVWSHPSGQWLCLADASSVEQEMVNTAIVALHKEVAAKVGEKTAEAIFTVPDESYIFYNNEGGTTQLLFTGWGFKKPVRTTGRGEKEQVEKRMPVDFCFTYDGERLLNYDFGLQIPKQMKELKTNNEGIYHFNNLKVGETYLLKDLKSGREFNLVVREGQSLYEFDVTDYTSIDVRATFDGEPLANESLTIDYNGKSIPLYTDENGMAQLQVALHEGLPFNGSMRDQTQSGTLAASGNTLVFAFESEKPVEEEPPTPPVPPTLFYPHLLVMGDEGFIGANYPVTVEYDGLITSYTSDANGIIPLPQMESGKTMRVTDVLNPENIADYTLDSNQEEYVFHVPYEPKTENQDIKVMVRDKDGKPIRCDHIRFQQEGPEGLNERLSTLDEEGNTYFAKDTFLIGPDIVTTLVGTAKEYEPITFTLEENENEYLLEEKGGGGWWYIILEILAVIAVAAGAILAWPAITDFFQAIGQML